MATKVCRTCGFADCPGATTGNCPRWPARDSLLCSHCERPVERNADDDYTHTSLDDALACIDPVVSVSR